MDGDKSLFENLSVYNNNLCPFYVGTVIISMLSFIIAWWYSRYEKKKRKSMEVDDLSHNRLRNNTDILSSSSDGNIMTQLKMARQNAIVEQLAAGLTEDQLKEERQAESEQLAAIFQLLRDQEDKFHVGSMEELEDQLRLYRH